MGSAAMLRVSDCVIQLAVTTGGMAAQSEIGSTNPPKQYHLKIKAICGAFLTVAAAAAGISYYSAFGAFGLIPTSGLLISTVGMMILMSRQNCRL